MFYPQANAQTLRTLQRAFLDLDPTLTFQVGELHMDLFFHKVQLGIVLLTFQMPEGARQELKDTCQQGPDYVGLSVLAIDVTLEGFEVGDVILELRRWLDLDQMPA